MKRLVIESIALAFMAVVPCASTAQDKVEASVGADLVSKYIWRGQDLGDAAIQPSLSLSYKGFTLGAWGSYGFVSSSDTKEFDLSLSYSVGGFSIGVTDYFFSGDAVSTDPKYFMYDAHRTSHVFEAMVGYDFGPLSVSWFTNFSGADGVNKDGDRAYSSYLELAAPFKLGGLDWSATVGAVPFATDFYDGGVGGFAVTNVTLKAAKDIKLNDSFSIPAFAAVTVNPHAETSYLTVGVSF